MRLSRVLVVAVVIAGATSEALAYEVYGAVGDKWRQLGAQAGPLGAPRSDERDAARGGRYNDFEHGFIYWHPSLGAHAVYGLIGEKWNALGRERGFGFPVTDEQPAAGGGRYNDFESGGSIYWHPATGAYAVYGAIRGRWHELGREAGPLGYPLTDEQDAAHGGRFSHFQHGSIYWHPTYGAHAVYGRIGQRWSELGRETGACGYPTRSEHDFDDGRDTGEYGVGTRFRRTDFAHGYILWSKRRDQLFVFCGTSRSPTPPPVSRVPLISVEGRPGAGQHTYEVHVGGSGFRPGEHATVRFRAAFAGGVNSWSLGSTVDADRLGRFATTFSLLCPPGTRFEIQAVGDQSGESPVVGFSR